MEAKTNLSLPYWNDFPDIDLYMDQLINLVNRYLKGFLPNPLTPSMVNSYVKKGLLQRPEKKKYQRQHLAELMIISLFKSVYSLELVKQVVQLVFEQAKPQTDYDNFAILFNQELNLIINQNNTAVSRNESTAPVLHQIEDYTIRAAIYQMLGQRAIQAEISAALEDK